MREKVSYRFFASNNLLRYYHNYNNDNDNENIIMINDNDNNNTNINDNDNNLDGNLGLECQGLVGEHGVGTVGPARM